MMNGSVARSVARTWMSTPLFPPTFLLPSRARYLSITSQHVEPTTNTPPIPSKHDTNTAMPTSSNLATQLAEVAPKSSSTSFNASTISPSVKEMLPLLSVQPSHYINIHIHAKPYLVTVGDILRLPFRMPEVKPGDVLRLDRATAIGSRDYTLKGTPYVDEKIFECRARVMGTESEPMRFKQKKKRRERRITTVKSKHRYTILRISELRINNLNQVEQALNAADE